MQHSSEPQHAHSLHTYTGIQAELGARAYLSFRCLSMWSVIILCFFYLFVSCFLNTTASRGLTSKTMFKYVYSVGERRWQFRPSCKCVWARVLILPFFMNSAPLPWPIVNPNIGTFSPVVTRFFCFNDKWRTRLDRGVNFKIILLRNLTWTDRRLMAINIIVGHGWRSWGNEGDMSSLRYRLLEFDFSRRIFLKMRSLENDLFELKWSPPWIIWLF